MQTILKSITLVLLLLGTCQLSAQSRSVDIQGIILDSLDQPLTGATIILMHAQDSLMEAFAIADQKGAFKVQAKDPDQYLLQITFVGYGTFVRALEIQADQSDIDYGIIRLNPDAVELADVTIKDTFIPIVFKKDTIEYHADAFATPPNAVVEDLLKRLPGVDVDQDGTIRAQGEEVQNVMVDGKPFFEDDPKVATRNIPADIVNKVQVFDQKSDFTEFTGIEDGQEEKTINLTIKDGKNKGTFGNLEGAYGLDERYKGDVSLNRFNDKMQLSLIGNGNNINEQAFTFREYLDFIGGLEDILSGGDIDFSQFPTNLIDNSGETEAYSGGLNFNYDFKNKTDFRSTYFFSDSDNTTANESNLRNLLGDGFFNTNTAGVDRTKVGNHSLRTQLKKTINNSQDLLFRGNIAFLQNQGQLISAANTMQEDQLFSSTDQFNNSRLAGLNWDTELNYRKKLAKKGRFFTGKAELDGRSSQNTSNLLNANRFATSIDTIAQQQITDLQTIDIIGTIDYVEPLGKTHYLKFDLQSRFLQNERQKSFLDKTESFDYLLNEQLSNRFDRTVNQNTLGAAYKYVASKFNLSFGLDAQQTRLKNQVSDGTPPLTKTFYSWLPNAQATYSMGSTRNLQFNYNTQIRIPTPEQLQPALDNSDPLNIYQGNPELQPEYSHQINLNYSNFNQFYFRSFFLGINVQFLQDRIINAVQVGEQLQQFIQPQNVQNEWLTNTYYSFEMPIPGIDLKGGLNGNMRLQRSNFLVNDIIDQYNLWDIRQGIRLENKSKDKLDIAVTYTFGFLGTFFKENSELDLPFTNHTFDINTYWYPFKSWTLHSNFSYQRFVKTSLDEGWNYPLLDIELRKSFKDNQWRVYLKGINLLDQELLFQRNSVGNQFYTNEKNRLGRIFQFGVVYKIRSFGK